MLVTFKFKKRNGQCYKLKKDISVKEARRIFKEEYKDDDNIVKVWLTHFGLWHSYTYKVLKEI